MAARSDVELELVKAQTAPALKRAMAGFGRVGVATASAGAVLGGFIVPLL